MNMVLIGICLLYTSGTPLSAQEVAQGYKTVKERSAIVRFKVTGEDAYFLAWTTTPWTLPSNVALCVNPNDTYCKVKAADGYTYYMAQDLLDTVLGKLAKDDEPAYDCLLYTSNSAAEGTCDIGMASRDLKDSETGAGLTPTVIAKDGIVVIVNNENKVDNMTKAQVNDVFRGTITDWSAIK